MNNIVIDDKMVHFCSLFEMHHVKTEYNVDKKLANHMSSGYATKLSAVDIAGSDDLLLVPYDQNGYAKIRKYLIDFGINLFFDATVIPNTSRTFEPLAMGFQNRWILPYKHARQANILNKIIISKQRYNAVRTMMETGGLTLSDAEKTFFSNQKNKAFIARALAREGK